MHVGAVHDQQQEQRGADHHQGHAAALLGVEVLFGRIGDLGLVRVAYACEDHDRVLQSLSDRISPRILNAPARLDTTARELEEYFAGRRHAFDVPLDWRLSSGFRSTVLHRLPDVGYGHTATYAVVAQLAETVELLAGADDPAAGEAQALALFHSVARDVPAYASFLCKHGIDPTSVQTVADFERLPLIDKRNYVSRYPLPERCHGGTLRGCDMVAVSSGSTGQPTVWPRRVEDEAPVPIAALIPA